MRILTAGALVLWFLSHSLMSQGVVRSWERLATGFSLLDDIDYVANSGSLLVSRPLLGSVGNLDLASGNYVPLTNGVVHGMALEPSGQALWVADFGPSQVRRVDLVSGATTQTIAVPGHPLEILFVTPTVMVVGALLGTNFATSPGHLAFVDIGQTPPPPPFVFATGIVGGMDLAYLPSGRLFVASLTSPELSEVLIPGGQVVPAIGPLTDCTDLIVGQDGAIYACTLFAQEIIRFDFSSTVPTRTSVAALLTSTLGPGLEDLSLDPNGDLLIATNQGEVWKLVLNAELVQTGLALSSFPFALDLRVPAYPDTSYQLLASFGIAAPVPVPGTSLQWHLAQDDLLALTLQAPVGLVQDFVGITDSNGTARGVVFTPILAPWLVFDVHFAGVLHAGGQIRHVTNALTVRILS